ncbi:hypothetical protein NDU88_006811 [Pleurodeles waltl]|uniref:Uncharacterized protein n=1 Tax=Pleurodeles waltl TaxID=8319 RepID=A0AAV7WFJ5_PLEWA|nr:hypothetical protein NDU88_006811 [Pleurodeles waltl]
MLRVGAIAREAGEGARLVSRSRALVGMLLTLGRHRKGRSRCRTFVPLHKGPQIKQKQVLEQWSSHLCCRYSDFLLGQVSTLSALHFTADLQGQKDKNPTRSVRGQRLVLGQLVACREELKRRETKKGAQTTSLQIRHRGEM